jgi:hypothetical protein
MSDVIERYSRPGHDREVHPITDHVGGVSLAEVARNVPAMQSALTAVAVSFANLGGAADVVRRQDERLRAAFWSPERADEAITEARELARTSTLTYQQAVDKVLDDDARARTAACMSASAEFPQVASHRDPTRGWLSRLLDRWTGRTP